MNLIHTDSLWNTTHSYWLIQQVDRHKEWLCSFLKVFFSPLAMLLKDTSLKTQLARYGHYNFWDTLDLWISGLLLNQVVMLTYSSLCEETTFICVSSLFVTISFRNFATHFSVHRSFSSLSRGWMWNARDSSICLEVHISVFSQILMHICIADYICIETFRLQILSQSQYSFNSNT